MYNLKKAILFAMAAVIFAGCLNSFSVKAEDENPNADVAAEAAEEVEEVETAEAVLDENVAEAVKGIVVSCSDLDDVVLSEKLEKEAEPDEKITSAVDRLIFGITSHTLDKAGKDAFLSVKAFSEYVSLNKKKKIMQTVSSSSSGANVTSSSLPYKYNQQMDIEVSDKEYGILCRIVQAEAGDQDVYGRILVVNVILNRMNYKKEFANTIEGVVFEKNQFSPITDGAYYRVTVDSKTEEAVQRALNGEDYSDGALYFFMRSGTSKSNAAWFDSLNFLFKYGCHEFFKY